MMPGAEGAGSAGQHPFSAWLTAVVAEYTMCCTFVFATQTSTCTNILTWWVRVEEVPCLMQLLLHSETEK